ncbi:HDOD domain-containing protein [Melioribacteraceae bacterium 4301-Me]|uniref:HDOD domain-containing protein n=1 Tax=Pyranulibacter aquaticus TaxID=3163344 RepID=UPI003595B680
MYKQGPEIKQENLNSQPRGKKPDISLIRNLPAIPTIMIEINNLLDNPLTSVNELANIINKDQGLTAKILKIANSPLYGLPRKVSTIEFAIVVLGFDHIRDIVIAITIIETFNKRKKDEMNLRKYWIHSLMVAGVSKKIAEEFSYGNPNEVFTAGLLHDLGISIIQRYYEEEYKKISGLITENKYNSLYAENITLGFTHQEVGELLLEKWNLPLTLCEAVANHHFPSESKNNKLVSSFIHLADYITNKLQLGDYMWDDHFELDEQVLSILGFDNHKKLESYIESLEDKIKLQFENIII